MIKKFKKSIFLGSFFFLSNFLFAQSKYTTNDKIISLDKQAISFRDKNEFTLSENVFLEVLKLKEINTGTNTSSYSNTILNFALLKEKENDLTKVDSLYKIAVDINDKIKSKDFTALFLQAKFFSKIRLYELAEINFLNIMIKTDKQDELYLKSMLELFSLYTSKGEFSKAEKVLSKLENENIIDIELKLLLLDEIAIFYRKQNNFEKYSMVVYEAFEIRLNKFDKNDPKICKSLNNLAFVAMDMGKYDDAKDLLLSAFNIHSKKYGLQNELSASYLNNLGIIYNELGDFEKSELYFNKALILREEILGIYNEDFISTVNSLSALYYNFNQFEKSLKLYEKYIDKINLRLYSVYDPYYLRTLVNFGLIYKSNNNIGKTNEKFSKSLNLINLQIRQGLDFMSAFEFNSFKNEFSSSIEIIYSSLNKISSEYHEINIGCYENELLVKNLSLRNQQRIKTSIQKSGDTILQSKYEQFVANKRQLNKLQELPIKNLPATFEKLSTETEQLEKEITRQSTLFADTKNALSVTWKQVQEKLQSNEVAIDIVAYNYYNKKWTDSIVYAAFVVKKEFKAPKYVPLFEQKQLEFLLQKSKTESDSSSIDKNYTDKAISGLFLKPLEQDLKDCTVVYLSPAGLGHQINFKALPVSGTETFGEKYQVHLLGSTAELVTYKVDQLDKSTNLQLYLYGGIDYNKKEVTAKATESNENLTATSFNEMSTRSGIAEFGYLAGTKVEVTQIATASKQNVLVTTLFTERNATEESIKQLDGKTMPFVLHLATHGFFFPDPKQELPEEKLQLSNEMTKSKIYKTSDDPMMRSGLLFAGANKFWGKISENSTADDGILTASEISNLDLSSCQLVVMSACETGLGEVNGSEGVFGLQRAFKMAGVKNIIMSLWKVPDIQTAELFDIFYKACFSGKSIHQAFQMAQSEMKHKYSPYYWAGFVLLE